ncbi:MULTISPECIES: signal recognition particle-docking protein FtsY [Marinomonas]|uniref:Signal recognition particle receptor FtsY n=1 Tax=Marinomonas arctica TaxID=383750 RepID=A0A7H1J623_9GAMM|nr:MULTISPECIES: signal recognition particle-docking protein FtsY [Marinomonas]MCS7484929.1 cell division protein FtsY [Marinomonas sp. BSi20414]QNT05939.1 signal recognition particle-docking protein FtsY [Marinomonas arctica]GGN20054.1 signal recognition particle receptor FtsY [Marinomonas arctica]
MEVVNQIVAFFTPYLGEYARYVPIVIGTLLAIIAFVIRRRFVNKMNARIAAAKQQDAQASAAMSQESELDQAASADVQDDKETNTLKRQELVTQVSTSPQPSLSWSQRIKSGLSRTRSGLGSGLSSVIGGHKKVDDDLLEALETQLLMADVGIDATQALISGLTDKLNRKELKDSATLLTHLKADMESILSQSQQVLDPVSQDGPFVILMVGVNGVGKTTTIGKLAKKYQAEGKSVMLAAGDTFRAAAVEQLQVWGERNNVPVVAQHTGADSASVIYDAIESAKAKGIDIVIADTAGRLQNKANLMNELSKVVRVMKKLDAKAPHEVMLVLDAGTGQNAISQAKLFSEAVGVSGITLTKLDGTAKGGIIFAIAKQFALPIRYIGVGEQAEDLRPFVAQEFVDALFDSE